MKSLLTVQIDPSRWLTVSEALSDDELSLLVKALAALMCDGNPMQYVTTSGLKIGYSLLSEPITDSMRRQERNRANGAKGGRPRTRRNTSEVLDEDRDKTDGGSLWVSSKKSKKEDLSPTPSIEEKNKKNILPAVVEDALSREQFKQEVLNNNLRQEQACTSLRIDPGEYQRLVGQVLNEWEFVDEPDWSYKHLLNTLRIKVRNQSKPIHHETRSKTGRDITDTAATCVKDYEGPF